MGDDDSSPASDWSGLPTDLLVSVLSLLEIRDLFSSAAVSLAWRAGCATIRELGRWPDAGPYLVYSSSDRDAGTATLHNISTGRSFHVALPDPPFRSRYIVGSSHGWLVTADVLSNLHLLNPVTGAQIALPPPESVAGVRASFNRHGVLRGHYIHNLYLGDHRRVIDDRDEPDHFWRPKKTRNFLYGKVILSSHPSSGDCTALLMHTPPWEQLSFARIGDTKWTWIDAMERCNSYEDIFYNDDDSLFYAIRGNGEIHTIDLNGHSPVVKVLFKVESHVFTTKHYVVRAPWGDLLHVNREYPDPPQDIAKSDDEYQSSNQEVEDNSLENQEDECSDDTDDSEVENNLLNKLDRAEKLTVHRVDLAKRETTEVQSLRDHVLLIGFSNAIMLHARDFPHLTPNCVYVTDDYRDYILCNPHCARQLACVDLEDGSFTDLSFPDSVLNWPPPVWLKPSCSLQK